MDQGLDILVIEDSPADFGLVRRQLRGTGHRCVQVAGEAELQAALGRTWDVILSDYAVPGLHFPSVLAALRSFLPETPIILVSGTVGPESTVEFVRQGLSDVVLKDNLARLQPAIERCMNEARERQRARALRQALQKSQQQYQDLFQHMQNGYARCALADDGAAGPDFIFLEVNPAFEALTGLENVTGRRATDVIPGIRHGKLMGICSKVAHTGIPERFETHIDGISAWFDIGVYRPARDQFVMVFDNVSGRKRMEAALRASEARLRLAQDAAKAGTWEWDTATNEHVWSAETWALYGLDPAANRASHGDWLAVVVPEDRDAAAFIAQRAARHGSELEVEFRVRRPDGSMRWLLSRGRPIHDGDAPRFLGIVIDVTEMVEARESLEAYRNRLEGMVDSRTAELESAKARLRRQNAALETAQRIAHIGSWEWAVDGDEVLWSDELYRIAGRDRTASCPGVRDQDSRFPPESLEKLRAAMQAAVEEGAPFMLDVKMQRPDGSQPWVTVRGEAERDEAGAVARLRGTVQDISERKALEEALQHYADEVEDLYQNAPCGYHTTDRLGRIVRMNDTLLRWLGYGRPDVEGHLSAAALVSPESAATLKGAFRQLRRGDTPGDVEIDFVRKDGSRLPTLVNALAVTDGRGRFVGARLSVHDMSALRQLSLEREAHARQMSAMSHRLVRVQEEERRQLANIVHDMISPNLAAARLNLGLLLAGQPSRLLVHLAHHFADIRALLDDTDTRMRDLCSDLRPPLLDFAGLRAAVDGYARLFSARTGVPVAVTGPESDSRLPPEVESALFRIVQEALANCARHARAARVTIRLWHDAEHASVSICDDGVGFELEHADQGEHGIVSMRERAEFIGGRFSLESSAGEGTRISVEI